MVMSSDNVISIREDGGGEYDVRECFREGGEIENIGHFTNLRDAMIAAEKYQQENEVEYGIAFFEYKK